MQVNELIKESSSNFIKRIIFRKKLKQYKHDLQESINKMESLKRDNQAIAEKIHDLTKEINCIETEFESITKLNYIPNDISEMDYYYQRDITEYEKNTLDLINWVKDDITKLTKTLELIDTSNILKDNEKVEELQKSMKEDTEDIGIPPAGSGFPWRRIRMPAVPPDFQIPEKAARLHPHLQRALFRQAEMHAVPDQRADGKCSRQPHRKDEYRIQQYK